MNEQKTYVKESGGGLNIITDTYDDFGVLVVRHRRVVDYNASLDGETDEVKLLAQEARFNAQNGGLNGT